MVGCRTVVQVMVGIGGGVGAGGGDLMGVVVGLAKRKRTWRGDERCGSTAGPTCVAARGIR
eukprot:2982119-Alexandrium_andersonii.AAC.1